MEIIDGRDHRHGENVYDQGLHRPDAWADEDFDSEEEAKAAYAEPGYLDSAMKARAFVSKSIGDRIDARFLERVHAIAAQHKSDEEDFRQGYRNANDKESHVPFFAGSDYPIGAPLLPALQELNATFTAPKSDDDITADLEKMPAFSETANNLLLYFLPKSEQQLKKEVNRVLEECYELLAASESPDGKLAIIASTHRKLENLHPFLDANTRTNRLILHKLLVENGMTPVILENPLEVHLKTDAEWARVLKQGMALWQQAAK